MRLLIRDMLWRPSSIRITVAEITALGSLKLTKDRHTRPIKHLVLNL